ncbi:NAD(P)-dependent oxidoreductase [Glycomyces halotolerans]
MVNQLPSPVLVTGAAGVLGSNLTARLLSEGTEVVAYDRREVPPSDRLRAVTGDVRDRAELARAASGCRAIVHCASALPSYPKADIRSITVGGAESVLEAAAAARVDRLVHISSTAVYGLPEHVPTPEDHPHEPVDAYSAAKAEAERAVAARASERCTSIVRPKTFLGPGRLGLFGMLFEWAEEGRDFPIIGKGDVRIQMLDLDDLVEAVTTVLAAPDETAADAYNVGAAEFATLREDFQAVLDAAGHGRRVRSLPTGPAVAALRLASAVKLSPVYDRLVRKLKADSYVDISKARERLGFAPRHSNREAVLRTYRWWRSRPQSDPGAAGATSADRWKQGLLASAKVCFPARAKGTDKGRGHDQHQDRGALTGRGRSGPA